MISGENYYDIEWIHILGKQCSVLSFDFYLHETESGVKNYNIYVQFRPNINEGPIDTSEYTDIVYTIWDYQIDWQNLPEITITTNVGEGTTVIVDGQTRDAPYLVNWEPGAEHTIGISSPQLAGEHKRYVFNNWSDGGEQNHTITVSNDITSYTADLWTQWKPLITLNNTESWNTVIKETHTKNGIVYIDE